MSKHVVCLTMICELMVSASAAMASGRNVAVIDGDWLIPGPGADWCALLQSHGHQCSLLPKEGPAGPLDPFDVVIDLSHDWSDSAAMLPDFMRAGKTVVTVFGAPLFLGIDSDPTVQAWIGANGFTSPSDRLLTTDVDPILGNISVGTQVGNCADGPCSGLTDTSGHASAKVLARFNVPGSPIGIMRNLWEGGVSVYLANVIYPGSPLADQIILNAVEARTPSIPALSVWCLILLALALGVAGALIIRRRVSCRASFIVVLACVVVVHPPAKAQVNSTHAGGVTYLRLGAGEAFHSTSNSVVNLRSVAIPNSTGIVVLWDEIDANGTREPFQATSFDATKVNDVGPTSYTLELKYAPFDPAIEEPEVPTALTNDSASELFIVQFVSKPLDARSQQQSRPKAP